MIKFNIPPKVGNEMKHVSEAIASGKLSGDGIFTDRCNNWIINETKCMNALLTTSCTHALEMSALLVNIKDGDEVIMPSYTFVSTANAFVMRGAKIIFVDIRPDTMNLNEKLIEAAITPRTKVIVPVHYAGVACDMDEICAIAKKYNLVVIEDAAQGVMATYEGRALGSMGTMGCYSFHDTKNYTMGEGGAILINDRKYAERTEIIREKGTNRSNFLKGQVDKYTWIDKGSSYLPSELNAAFLWGQLEYAQVINKERIKIWNKYFEGLKKLGEEGFIELPFVPNECKHNAHMFYIKTKDIQERSELILYLKNNNISSAFHYVPLHSSPAGKRYGEFNGVDRYTTRESERLLRLPMYYGLREEEVSYIVEKIRSFYSKVRSSK